MIKSTKGLQLLRGLEELDLRCNLIASIHEVVRLSGNHRRQKPTMHSLAATRLLLMTALTKPLGPAFQILS